MHNVNYQWEQDHGGSYRKRIFGEKHCPRCVSAVARPYEEITLQSSDSYYENSFVDCNDNIMNTHDS